MTRTLRLISSNDLNSLADALGEEFFSSSSRPFENRLVVVPHPGIKEFLFRRFALHPRLKIAAGLQVLPLNQAVMEILDSVAKSPNGKRIPSFPELSLSIEEKLHLISAENPEFSTLLSYLDAGDKDKQRKRIAALSDELARLFARYGLFGKQFLPEWLRSEGWQQILWKALFSQESPWTYPLESLKGVKPDCFQSKVALFGFSYLSASHLAFFGTLPASIYHLSPCALFWEDLASDKERLFTNRFLQRKGAKEEVRKQIDNYMQQSHPLLGNFGKIGREMLKSLDSFLLAEDEVYRNSERDRLLDKLKNSMLNLDEEEMLRADDSIQLHSASSKLREVEILRDALQTIIHAHSREKNPIRPRDIVVASPDISSYAPYIHMVFSQAGFSYTVDGMPLKSVSATVRGFLQLIDLPKERYALASLIELLRCPSLMEKWGLSHDEVHHLSQWFRQAQVKRDLSGNPNSWEEGIDRLLCGLAMNSDEESHFETWPVSGIPQSEIDLFNRFLALFSELKSDLSFLEQIRSASEWLEMFLRTADKYFAIEWERESFFQEIKTLGVSCRGLKEKVWNFQSISRVLHHLADKPAGAAASSQMDKITFTSLKAGSISPARIIWCLGMDEGAYPGADAKSSLCEMSRLKSADYFPLKVDEDRSLFLEMLMKAQDYLIFSYQRIHPEDGKHQGPSLLIDELNQYLQKRGAAGGMEQIDHPSFPFDRSYFASGAKVRKWSEEDYHAAAAHYFPHREKGPLFELKNVDSNEPKEIVIDIRQIKKLARSPLQFYFNETLKIYLDEEEDEEETEFFISSLRKSILRKKALQNSLPQVMRELKGQGQLPRGLFCEASQRELEEEMQDLLSVLDKFDVRPEEIKTVRFSASCSEKEKSEFLLPPLSVTLSDSRVVHITGELEDVSPKGLIAHVEKNFYGLVRTWPLYLIYRCLNPENRALLLTKKGNKVEFPIADPKGALATYLEYYLLAKCNPSPLMPDWAKAVLEGGEEELRNEMSKESERTDRYLTYLNRRQGLFDPKEALLKWSAILKRTFEPLRGGPDAL
ncbi:MAG: exodeoxyribonuclease V subunit gamma [Verrucomicrobia bacterium]|nr:exodeoxyribonuclease V subunit gamma [Verrucomicrobiota bacterium]